MAAGRAHGPGVGLTWACSCRRSGPWKPSRTASASAPMGTSTWRCLPRTCSPAVATSVGTGESAATPPAAGPQVEASLRAGKVVQGRQPSFAETAWGPWESGSRPRCDCCLQGAPVAAAVQARQTWIWVCLRICGETSDLRPGCLLRSLSLLPEM